MSQLAKYASLTVTLVGGLTHSFLALQLAAAWRTLRALGAENELDAWKLDGLRVLGALLALYLLAAATVSFVGFFGVVRNKPAHLRLYRDCSAADLLFTLFLTLLALYSALAPATPLCDELGRQPELAQLLALLAPDEACERSLARGALSLLAGMLVLSVVRLHFLLAVSTHYRHLLQAAAAASSVDYTGVGGVGANGATHIRLLPLPPHVPAAEVVWAPVHCPAGAPLGARAEVWVRAAPQGQAQGLGQHGPGGEAQVAGDAGLLDAGVVERKREWI